MSAHRTIPIFIPERACPFRCIYCNQHVISGQQQMPTDAEILSTIDTYLPTFPSDAVVELGFFGGTFTGLPLDEQQRLLALVHPYLDEGRISSIRISTRPDYITPEIVDVLSRGGVGTVELGVQSLDDAVLAQVRRGYTAADVLRAAGMIHSAGLSLGMQMMVGLPGDTAEKSLSTAQQIIASGADNTRIYPTLVVRQTVLASLYEKGLYHPLSIDEAVQWTAPVLRAFQEADVTVLRVGLHPTDGFINHTDYLAGPFHVSFKELVMTEIFRQEFRHRLLPAGGIFGREKNLKKLTLFVHPSMVNAAVGYGGSNKRLLLSVFCSVSVHADSSLKGYDFTSVIE